MFGLILTPVSNYTLSGPSNFSFLTTAIHCFVSTSHNNFMSVVCLQPNLNFLQEKGRHRDVHRLEKVTTGRLKSKSPFTNVIFRRDVYDICTLLGCYAVQSGNSLPIFWVPDIPVSNKHSRLCFNLEERRSHYPLNLVQQKTRF